jgi:DNA (cytosine-5)-methyltransferase 1
MRTLDLFTGIGGMALALRGYTRPILYCEIDEACRAVLSERMRAGDIERAPVHGDARTLFAAHLGLEMIVGGFPCQDISSMGTNSGVHGRRSSLFFEIMRVIDESPTVECVFLENVANIVSCDLEVVLRELAARGFTVHWTTRSAGEHGAPHVRQRWFALAHRGEGAAKCAALAGGATAERAPWPTEPAERCALRPTLGPDELFDPHWARRCRMLGNALVPCVARGAFEYLARAASVIEPLMLVAPLIGVRFAAEPHPAPSPAPAPARFPRDATLLPGGIVCAHAGRECPDGSAAAIDTRVANGPDLVHVPTPRHGNVYGGPASERNLRGTLGVFLVNCEVSTARAIERGASADVPMHKQIVPNARYVEWMMGFPEDWTRVQSIDAGDEPRRRARSVAQEGPRSEEGPQGQEATPTTTTAPRVFRKNGMHVLMSERSLGVRAASLVWRALSAAERGVYSERARSFS